MAVPIAQKMHHHHMMYDDHSLTFLQDDPTCSSQGCPYNHIWGDGSENLYPEAYFGNQPEVKVHVPVKYPNPEAEGLDSDIKSTLTHARWAADNIGEEDPFP